MSYTASPPISFELKPSELPLGCTAPLCAPADGRLVRNGDVILLRLIRLRRERFALWVRWRERNFVAVYGRAPQIWKGKPTADKLRRIAGNLGGGWTLASVYQVPYAPSGRSYTAINRGFHPFMWQEGANKAWLSDDWNEAIGFDFNNGRYGVSTEDALAKALCNEDTPTYFAWRWSRANAGERAAIWGSQHRKNAELNQLLTWVLWCQPEFWERNERVVLTHSHAGWSQNWCSTIDFSAGQKSELHKARFCLQWGQELRRHFDPHPAWEFQQHNSQLGLPELTDYAHVSAPSAHQQLEAHLHLRDWLQRNAPDKLSELLPT